MFTTHSEYSVIHDTVWSKMFLFKNVNKQGRVVPFRHTVMHAQKNNTNQPGRAKSFSFFGSSPECPDIFRLFFKWKTDTHTPKGIKQTPRNILLQFYMGYFYRSVLLCGFHWEWNESVLLLPWKPVSLWLAEQYPGFNNIPESTSPVNG